MDVSMNAQESSASASYKDLVQSKNRFSSPTGYVSSPSYENLVIQKRKREAASAVDSGKEQSWKPMESSGLQESNFTKFIKRQQDRATWHPARYKVEALLENTMFKRFIAGLIVFNMVIMVVDANHNANCVPQCGQESVRPTDILNFGFLLVYTVELFLRIYVYRLLCLTVSWDVIDGLGVLLGYVDIILANAYPAFPNMQLLRIFRVLRMFRSGRLLLASPELYAYVRGFAAAIRSMLWGVLIVMFVLLLTSLVSVELVHPRTVELFGQDHHCSAIFVSVQHAMLYYFRTAVTGDGWGDCAVPISKAYVWPFFVFASAYIVVQLGLLNMLLSVVVDSAAAAREVDLEHKAIQAKKDKEESSQRLLRIIQNIDVNSDGAISKDELLMGYDADKSELRNVVTSLHIDRDELGRLFRCLDADHSGSLDYTEFVKQIQKAHSSDLRVQFMLLKMEIQEMSHRLQNQFRVLRGEHALPDRDLSFSATSSNNSRLPEAPSPPRQDNFEQETICAHANPANPIEGNVDRFIRAFDTHPMKSVEGDVDHFVRDSETQLASLANNVAARRMDQICDSRYANAKAEHATRLCCL